MQVLERGDRSWPLMRGFGLPHGKPTTFPGADSLMPTLGVIWKNLSGGGNWGQGSGDRSGEKALFCPP